MHYTDLQNKIFKISQIILSVNSNLRYGEKSLDYKVSL